MTNDKQDPESSEHVDKLKIHGRAKKKPVSKSVWVLVVLVLILFGFVGAMGNSNSPSINTAANTPATTPSPTPAAKQAPVAHVGSTVSVKDQSGNPMDITMVKVVDPATGGDAYTHPDSGKRFVGVQIKITNTGTNSISEDSNNNATVYDNASQSYNTDTSQLADCPGFALSLKLAPGSSVLGCVAFQLPTGASLTKFQYTPSSGFSDSTGEWLVP